MTMKPSYEELEKRVQELQESEIYYRTLFENVNDAVLVHEIGFDGKPGKFIDANRVALKRLGYTHDELLTLTPKDITTEKGYKDLSETRANITSNCAAIFETTHLARNGRPIPVESHVSTVEIAGRQVAVSVVRDLSERKIAEKVLKERVKELTFLHSISRIVQEEDSCGHICQKIVCAMPKAWYYPEITCARIICEGQSYQTDNFRKTEWCLSADIKVKNKSVGSVEVFYLEDRPARDEGPFIQEERNLINICAERLGRVIERIQVEKQLQKSEEQFRDLYDNAPVGYFEYDLRGNITRVNNTYLGMLGYIAEEVIGNPCWEFIVDEVAREQIMAKLDGVRPPAIGLERTYRRKDGTTFPVLFQDRLLLDEAGHIKGIRTTIQDITARKDAEESLKEREESLQAILDNSPTLISEYDLEGRYIRVNQAVTKLLKRNASDLVGKTFNEILPADTVELFMKRIEIVSKTCEPITVEDHLSAPEGDQYFITTIFPLFDASGRIQRIGGIANNITERKQFETALLKSEERYRNMAEANAGIVWEMDANLTVTHYSGRVYDILGYAPEEIIGRNPLFLIDPEDRERIRVIMTRMVQTQEPVKDIECWCRHSDGRRVRILTNGIAFFALDGSLLGFRGTQIDITEIFWARRCQEIVLQLHSMFNDSDDAISDFLCKACSEVTDSSMAFFGILEPDESAMMAHVWSPEAMEDCRISDKPLHFPIETAGLWAQPIRMRKPVIVNEYQSAVEKQGLPEGHVPITRYLGIPILHGDSVVAVAGAANKSSGYEERHINRLQVIISSIADILLLRRKKEALRNSEEKHRTLIEGLPDTVMRFDRDGRHLFVSNNVRKTVGIEPDRFIGKTHAELGFPDEQCQFWEDSIRRVFDNGALFETEFTFEGKAGPVIFDWRLIPERDAQGVVSSVLSISRDITAHRKAEQDYQTLFHEMLDGFSLHEIILDVAGTPVDYRFLATNPAFERMTGLKAEEIAGRTVLEVLPGTEPHWIETFGRVALTGEPAHFENYSTEIGKHFEVTAFRPGSGQFACIFQDITERKKTESEREKFQAQLTQIQKMESIGSLAGGIAHDFNNILFPIVGLSEMMLDDFPPGSIEHQNLQEIYQAGKRGRKLVQQILSFSRQSENQPIPVHIQRILKEVLKLCRATIPADIPMTQDIKTDCGPVMADPTQIHQIIMNLITNAYHAVESAGGTISIQLTEMDVTSTDDPSDDLVPGRYAVLTVSDTGIGIDGAVIDKIFDPYFTTKEKGRGTGLGLATVYGIVKAHKGDIRVYSDVGKGATFHVYLPLMEKSQEFKPEKEIMMPLPTGTEHILLVDDEKAIVHLEKQMLERLGYQTSVFTSSRDALTAFKTEPTLFDFVITDMNMPNMNGMKLATELIAIRPDIPIILCTGFSERINNKKAEAQGIRGLLMKPVGMKDLAKKIQEVLDTIKKES